MAETFKIEDKTALDEAIGTENILVQQADSTYRKITTDALLSSTSAIGNIVTVEEESDFGNVVGGAIQLANNTHYDIVKPITMANRLILAPIGGFSSRDGSVVVLVYTGALTFITGPDIDSFQNYNLVIIAVNPAAVLFAATGLPVVFPGFFILENISYIGFSDLGTVTNIGNRFTNVAFINFGQGIKLTGGTVSQINGSLIQNAVAATSPFISYSGTHALIQVKNCTFNTIATEEVLDIDPAIILTEAVISGNVFRNSTSSWFAAGSLLEEDVRFEYADNGDAPESAETANIFISASAGTVIGTPGTFVMVNGTYSAETAKRFTHSAGVLTYTGRKTRTFIILASVSFTSSANNREVDLRVAKNTVSDANSNQRRKIGTGSDIGNMGVVHEVTLDTGDTVELQWSTVGSTSTLTAEFMNLTIS